MLADFLDVGYEVPSGVFFERSVGCALTAATLVEIHNAVLLWVKEAALFRIGATARTTMQKDHRFARWVARLLEIDFVNG